MTGQLLESKGTGNVTISASANEGDDDDSAAQEEADIDGTVATLVLIGLKNLLLDAF